MPEIDILSFELEIETALPEIEIRLPEIDTLIALNYRWRRPVLKLKMAASRP